MLCVRVTPIIPKWFVNLASPIVGIPFKVYFLATLIGNENPKKFLISPTQGYIPANLILIKMGLTLNNLENLGMNREVYEIIYFDNN